MNLNTAARLSSTSRVALVGGGGKTTTLFTLAREFPAPVIVAATAQLALEQATLADRHVFVDDATALDIQLPTGVMLFTGPSNHGGKTTGLSAHALQRVLEFAERYRAPLLIEANGLKGLPLKAPAEYEPPIPDLSIR